MKNKKSHIYLLIRDKDKLVLLISAIFISFISFLYFYIQYTRYMEMATFEIIGNKRVYYMKVDPNDILSHTGIGIVIFIIICIAVVFYNKSYLEKRSRSDYLLRRVPEKGFYFKAVVEYPIRCAILGVLVMVLLEAGYIYYTFNFDVKLIDLGSSVDYLRIIF